MNEKADAYQIRKLTVLDVHLYKRMRLLSVKTDPDAFFLQHAQAANLPDVFFANELFSLGESFGFYGAFDQGELIGMISVQPVQISVVQLFTLYVKPQLRRKGIGKMLLEHVLSIISPEETIRLTVIAGNPAITLYESLGFVQVGVNKGALANDHGVFDELVFQRKT